jgi:acetyl-CoA C-acetyltransferase
MGIGPVPAVRKLLERADLKLDDIDLFEVNEAFAAQALAVTAELGLPPDRTNPNGSGISLGHPSPPPAPSSPSRPCMSCAGPAAGTPS